MLFWQRFLLQQILGLLFALVSLVAATLHADEPTRIALVGDTTQPDLLNLLSVAEVELGQDTTLELLERANIDRILAEQSMSLTGVVDSKKIVEAGQAITADLFAMIDRFEKSGPVSLIVFDAQTGVRYVHQSITAKPAALPKQVAQAVRSGVNKFRLSEKDGKRTVGIFSIRNVNLGRTEDNWCLGVAAIVERRLLASPQVAVLDRTYLEQVSVERAVSPDAPIQKLLAAMARIELEYEKKDKGQVEIRASVKLRGGKRQTSSILASRGEPVKGVDQLIGNLVKQLDIAKLPKANRSVEVKLLLKESLFYGSHKNQKHLARAGILTDAAFALGHDIPELQESLSTLLAGQSRSLRRSVKSIDDSDETRDAILNSLRYSNMAFEIDLKFLRQSLADWKDTRSKQSKSSFEELRINRVFQSSSHSGQMLWFESMRDGQLKNAHAELGRLRSYFNELNALKLVMMSKLISEPHKLRNVNPYHRGITLHNFIEINVRPVRDDWPDVQLRFIDETLNMLEKHNFPLLKPTRLKRDPIVDSYAMWFAGLLPPQAKQASWKEPWIQVDAKSWRKLRGGYHRLSQHEKPAIRILGQLGMLLVDMKLDPQREGWQSSVEKWYEESEKKLSDSAIVADDAERFACYEAMIMGIHLLKEYADPRFEEQLFETMIGRKELVLRVIDSVCRDTGDITRSSYFFNGALVGASRNDPRKKARFARVAKLFQDEHVSIVDRNGKLIEKRLIEQNFHIKVDLVEHPINAVPLIELSDLPNMILLSTPIFLENDIYFFGVSKSNGIESVHVISTTFARPKPKIVASLVLTRRQKPAFRDYYSLLKPVKVGARMYCMGSHWHGLFEFNMQTGKIVCMTPKSDPDMPVYRFNLLAAVEDKLFGFASWGENGGSVSSVVSLEPANNRWTTIGNSRRLEKKTVLDNTLNYHADIVFDQPKRRLLILASDHLYRGEMILALDVDTYKVSLLDKLHKKYNPLALTQIRDNRFWLTQNLPPSFGRKKRRRKEVKSTRHNNKYVAYPEFSQNSIIELNLKNPKHNRLLHRTDHGIFQHNQTLYPPYVQIEDEFWSYCPLATVSLTTGKIELWQPPGKTPEVFNSPSRYFSHPTRTFLHLPEKQKLIYGSYQGLWAIDVSRKATGSKKTKAINND